MFNRKLKEQIEYLYAKIRKVDRLEKRIEKLEGKRLCQCTDKEPKK